jgi:hypothetical protein
LFKVDTPTNKPIQHINSKANTMSKIKDTIPDPYDMAWQDGYAQGRRDAAEAIQNLMLNARAGSLTHMITETAKGTA